LLLSIPKLQ